MWRGWLQLEPWRAPDCLLEFGPGQQISQARLEIIRLSLICVRGGLATIGNECHALGQLVLGQPLTLLPQLNHLVCHLD